MFDTLKFTVPNEFLIFDNLSLFEEIKTTQIDIIIKSHKKVLVNFQPGLNYIGINLITNKTTIGISAKILAENYLKGISADNIEFCLNSIKKYKFFYFINTDIINNAIVHRADLTFNLFTNIPADDFMNYFAAICFTPKINFTSYLPDGIIYMYNVMSERTKLRMIIYNKITELLKNKKNMPFNFVIPNKQIIRFEFNVNNYHYLRKFCGIEAEENTTLKNVLTAKINPFTTAFNFISNHIYFTESPSNDINKFTKLSSLENYLGKKEIAKLFDNNISKLSTFIKSKVKGNVSKYIKDYSLLIDKFNQSDANNSSEIVSILKQRPFCP